MLNLFQSADDLGEYLFRIVDNGGETADRYTVLFSDGDALALSDNPSAPWGGVSLWVENMDPATLQEWIDEGRAVDLGWHDLPLSIRLHILARLNDGYRDHYTRLGLFAPVGREAVAENEGTHRDAGKGIYKASPGGAHYVRREGDGEDDLGPFGTVRAAILASLPDHYALAGPEYHSEATSGAAEAGEPCPEVAAAVAALEAKHEAARAVG